MFFYRVRYGPINFTKGHNSNPTDGCGQEGWAGPAGRYGTNRAGEDRSAVPRARCAQLLQHQIHLVRGEATARDKEKMQEKHPQKMAVSRTLLYIYNVYTHIYIYIYCCKTL